VKVMDLKDGVYEDLVSGSVIVKEMDSVKDGKKKLRVQDSNLRPMD